MGLGMASCRSFLVPAGTMLMLLALMLLAAAPTGAGSEEATTGGLKQVGALSCTASRDEVGPATTKLDCLLRLDGGMHPDARLLGEMYGNGLYLVSPGYIEVLWNVLAPTRVIAPGSLTGEYDRISSHDFPYVRDNGNVLVGGLNDVIALELIAPTIDAIDASTRLVLRRAS